ncbi:hypothetical protein EJB05_33665, partial [Eragrostis curvula]
MAPVGAFLNTTEVRAALGVRGDDAAASAWEECSDAPSPCSPRQAAPLLDPPLGTTPCLDALGRFLPATSSTPSWHLGAAIMVELALLVRRRRLAPRCLADHVMFRELNDRGRDCREQQCPGLYYLLPPIEASHLPANYPLACVQCNVGHVVCSPCHDKLEETEADGRCHVCRAPTTGGYRRCHAMEQLVDSIHVPCPHAAYGCAAKPAYHDRERHAVACAHAPCRCPDKACLFFGSTTALRDHVADAHGRPCTAEISSEATINLYIRDGFNFPTAVRGDDQFLFLLNVARAPFGRAIFAVRIRPQATAAAGGGGMRARALLLPQRLLRRHVPSIHSQISVFKVECTDLSGGLPDPNVSFHFLIPKYVPGHKEDFIEVAAALVISNVPRHPTGS